MFFQIGISITFILFSIFAYLTTYVEVISFRLLYGITIIYVLFFVFCYFVAPETKPENIAQLISIKEQFFTLFQNRENLKNLIMGINLLVMWRLTGVYVLCFF